MDTYDADTVKKITKQFPKDKSIKFLCRLLKESETQKQQIRLQLLEKNKIVMQDANTIANLKGEIKFLRTDTSSLEVLSAYKKVPILERKVKRLKEKLIKQDTTINNLILVKLKKDAT